MSGQGRSPGVFRGISEIVLIVRDVRAAARFYREVIGLTPDTEPTDEWAWFLAGEFPGGAVSRLAVHKGPLLFEEESPRAELPLGSRLSGPIHFALRVAREDIPALVGRVESHGHSVLGPHEFPWMRARGWYVYDPDDNLVEFWSPDPV